jgi:segregation and condensation protein B
MQDIINIVESLLFVSEEPLTIDKLKTVLETVEAKEIKSALQALSDQYAARGGGFMLCEVAGGWQLRSRPEYNEWIRRMLQPSPQRLSKPALETLAIIAYNQPIIRADIEHIRGVDCGGVLRQLMERKLVRVLGRKEIPGRPLIYATTRLFLELFGLKDLKDLPSPKEIEEMAAAMEEANKDAPTDKSINRGVDLWETSGEFNESDSQFTDVNLGQTAPDHPMQALGGFPKNAA